MKRILNKKNDKVMFFDGVGGRGGRVHLHYIGKSRLGPQPPPPKKFRYQFFFV